MPRHRFVKRSRRPRHAVRAIALAVLALALLLGAGAPAGQPPSHQFGASEQLAQKLRRRGDLTLSDATLRQALFTVSETWDINLVVGEDVQGRVNGVFRDAPLHEILQSVLLANDYGYRAVGEGLVVMRLQELGDVNPLFESATIKLHAIDPADVLEGAQLLSSPQGRVHAIPSARSLLVIDLPERVRLIREFAEGVDASAGGPTSGGERLEVAHFSPQFTRATVLGQSLGSVLSAEGKVSVIEEENRLVAVDYPANLRLAENMVQKLDQPRPQVRITAFIYDVSMGDMERLGINWGHSTKGRVNGSGDPQTLWSFNSLMQTPAAAADPSGVMTFMNLSSNFDVTAVIDALNQCDNSRLLADPHVTVVDREEASIQIVTEIPYQQLTQTSAGGEIGTTAFREAGVTLDVEPQIASDGTILMDVMPTFSIYTGNTPGPNPQPIIDKRQASTTVRVANGQTVVIGGLRQRSSITNDRGLPHLSNIKKWGIGKLFSAYNNEFEESELLVFITPEIVTPVCAGTPREMSAYHAGEPELQRIPIQATPPGFGPQAPHLQMAPEIETPPPGEPTPATPRHDPPLDPAHSPLPASSDAPPASAQEERSARSSLRRLPAIGDGDNAERRADITRLPAAPL